MTVGLAEAVVSELGELGAGAWIAIRPPGWNDRWGVIEVGELLAIPCVVAEGEGEAAERIRGLLGG